MDGGMLSSSAAQGDQTQTDSHITIRRTTYRAYSMTAACMPRQMPRKGMRVSRAQRMAPTFPSRPRVPKPPGTCFFGLVVIICYCVCEM